MASQLIHNLDLSMSVHNLGLVEIMFGFWACTVTPQPGGPLTTRQPAEYKWMSGYPTPLQKIRAESPLYGELYPNKTPA